MKQNMFIGMNRPTTNQKGVIRYSDKYKDVLERAYKREQQLKPKIKNTQLFFYRVRSIGVGAFSFVYLVREENTGSIYAQKSINKKSIAPELITQIKMHLSLHHENIVNLYHVYSQEGYINLIMDFAGESLFALRKNGKIPYIMPQSLAISILKQLIQAVSYLHGRGIVHADIKLQNILCEEGVVKLCDFGYAHICNKDKCQQKENRYKEICTNSEGGDNNENKDYKQVVGTLQYLDPQYVQGKNSEFSRDIWAIGIVAYQLLVGKNPFEGMSQNQKWSTILKISHINTKDLKISPQMSQFLSLTLCPISYRASIEKLKNLEFLNKFQQSSHQFLDAEQIKILS